ncbi:T9SS type A sorting domain-containing protein [Pontibacter sp. SGAir0037]|uniref:T9SS type A sorting domain-containing protein n=1 Tax=Pontibacter sp. SGAir0037 TaxID=2571030 RepID=UPI0010CCBF33|nr:T9SS type A sorting domain-containing protein [Pontibacter sp. SGAir0037]QCR21428.1 hypothetical protein C1N53_03055 [Pontibacter sp. SGAir0037]
MKQTLLLVFLCSVLISLVFPEQAAGQSVFINEIHYDNNGADVNEGVEVAGPAGTDLTGWSIVFYNGSGGASYGTRSLSGIIANQANGYGFVHVPYAGIQNGSPDGVALVDANNQVVQFLSYEGAFVATSGPANGMSSTDIGVSQPGTGPETFSLQLSGTGKVYTDFTWVAEAQSTFGAANNNQGFGTGGGGTTPDPEPEPEPDPQPETPGKVIVFINEIHYDNAGTDVNEGVEVAGLAGTNLAGWQLVPYNGSNGATYNPIVNLSGIIPNQQNGYGAVFFPINGLQNGAPDGIALVDAAGKVVQFLSYEGAFTATNGPANGMTSTDIGVLQTGSEAIGLTLQLTGIGSAYEDFTWTAALASTYNEVNNGQVFLPQGDIVFINELHYDNVGTDVNEGVELAGKAGTDLSGWRLIPYNGSNGATYAPIITLSGTIPNQQNGFGTVFFPISGLQNGAPDGIALVNAADSVLQFLSYEGVFTATNGPAAGMLSTDIGVEQDANTPLNTSLQLTGSGFIYQDFTWSSSMASTYNAVNTGQLFGIGEPEPEPDPEPQQVNIAQARALRIGTPVIVNGTITAASELGGPAFIQDTTGGIAVFGYAVHGPGNYQIGDSIQVTAVIGEFNQQLQLVDVVKVESYGVATNPITPVIITASQVAAYEGQLVAVPGVSFTDKRGLLFPESNYNVTDGTATLQVRIDGDVQSLVGRVKPQDAVTITGVVGSFRGTPQLLPRFEADLPGTRPYVAAGSDVPVAKTLDVMSWNMEFFGSTLPTYGPSDVQLQLQNAKKVIESSKADIIAVQEISDENLLQQLVDMLPGYARVCSDRFSYSFNGPDPTFPEQKVCFIYNTAFISVVSDRVVFEEMYDAARTGASTPLNNYPTSPSSFWSSGRLPYMLTVDATIEGVTERISLINIHAKSGSANADLIRRRYDVQALKDTLDQYYPDVNLILLGDYNDDVDESIGGGASTYASFVTADNFRVVTSTLSEAGLRSFITQDNVIDHITISDELYDEYYAGSETLIIPFNLIPNYANTTSDHLPVMTRFEFNEPLVADAGADKTVYFGYPPTACATLTASATGGEAGYTYSWSTGETTATISVCPEVSTVYTVTVTDARGRTTTDAVQVHVVNVSCSNNGNNQKVLLCHNPSGKPGKEKTLCVSINAVEEHLAKGATLGSCAASGAYEPEVSFAVSPNPVADVLNIEFESADAGEVEVVIYDKNGQAIYSKSHKVKNGTITLNTKSLKMTSGIYYLKISNGSSTQSLKVVKQ